MTGIDILGWFAIPFGLMYSKIIDGSAKPYRDHPVETHGAHALKVLPDWKIDGYPLFKIHQNFWDGAMGDKRGWYNNKFKWLPRLLRESWWMMIRNPKNAYGRLVNSFDLARCKTEVVEGYEEYVDEDSGIFGESLIKATDLVTGEEYFSYVSMKKLWFGYYLLRKDGHKFKYGEERIPFPDREIELTYENIRALCYEYARDGYHKGEAQLTLDRLAPWSGRKKWMFTIKKIKS